MLDLRCDGSGEIRALELALCRIPISGGMVERSIQGLDSRLEIGFITDGLFDPLPQVMRRQTSKVGESVLRGAVRCDMGEQFSHLAIRFDDTTGSDGFLEDPYPTLRPKDPAEIMVCIQWILDGKGVWVESWSTSSSVILSIEQQLDRTLPRRRPPLRFSRRRT